MMSTEGKTINKEAKNLIKNQRGLNNDGAFNS